MPTLAWSAWIQFYAKKWRREGLVPGGRWPRIEARANLPAGPMKSFVFEASTRVIFGEGSVRELDRTARELGFGRTLLVSDPGLVESGHVETVSGILADAGVRVHRFHDFGSDPDSRMVERGAKFARPLEIDSLVGLGGGSSMDCAKGINFLLTGGGRIHDYQGYGRVRGRMLPMIGIPTTTGTGSEAQSYAIIADARTHVKMACGDPQAAFRVAMLDPCLTLSQPAEVTSATGFDALSHAVESYCSKRSTPLSQSFSREAWWLLERNYERVLCDPTDLAARGAMQLGAFYAGLAIENSSVGAAHACANPLSARYRTPHGVAIGLLLSPVIRWTGGAAESAYGDLLHLSGSNSWKGGSASESLAGRLDKLAVLAQLPRELRSEGVSEEDLDGLASDASGHWTVEFNPRLLTSLGAMEIYREAW